MRVIGKSVTHWSKNSNPFRSPNNQLNKQSNMKLPDHLAYGFVRFQIKKARPKFYFFDCGVVRALQSRITENLNTQELGVLFETWVANELIRIRDYLEYEHTISLWRQGRWEIDFIIESTKEPLFAIECKSGQHIKNKHAIDAFRKYFPKVPLVICSLLDQRTRK